jgi:hypothetical protein
MMEAIHNKIGMPTRMASGDRDGDCLHLRTTTFMIQKTYSPAPEQLTHFLDEPELIKWD